MFLRLLVHSVRRADSRAACTAGSNSATSTPMMAITTNNSTSVNPSCRSTFHDHAFCPVKGCRESPVNCFFKNGIHAKLVGHARCLWLTSQLGSTYLGGWVRCSFLSTTDAKQLAALIHWWCRRDIETSHALRRTAASWLRFAYNNRECGKVISRRKGLYLGQARISSEPSPATSTERIQAHDRREVRCSMPIWLLAVRSTAHLGSPQDGEAELHIQFHV